MRRVSIKDVAAAAGVSIGTASKALNGHGKLRDETRDRVAQAAERLGFAPNTLAQALLAGAGLWSASPARAKRRPRRHQDHPIRRM